jgi:hypothetical protein
LKTWKFGEGTSLRPSPPPDEPGVGVRGGFRILRGEQDVPDVGVLLHAVAIAANRHDVTEVDEAIDERRHHDVVPKSSPLL